MMEEKAEKMKARKHLKTTKEASQIIKQYYAEQQEKASKEGLPVAWCCIAAPRDIMQALDVQAFYPEQYASYLASRDCTTRFIQYAESAGYANELCGYARTIMGYIMDGLPPDVPAGGMSRPDFFIITSAVCDNRVKWFEEMADMFDAPIYLLEFPEMPPETRQGASSGEEVLIMVQIGSKDAPHLMGYTVQQYQGLVRFLEEQTGKKLDPNKLEEIRARSRDVGKLRKEINEYRKAIPTPMGAADGYTAMFPGTYLPGTKISDEFYTKLREEVKYRLDNKIGIVPEEKFRLAWSGIPFWYNMGLINYFEDYGGVVVIDTQYGAAGTTINTSSPRQPKRWGINRTVASVVRAVIDYNLDGVILSYTPTCRALYINQLEMKNTLEEELDVPALLLESDMVDPSSYNEAEIMMKIDAFIEQVTEKAKHRDWLKEA
jgi:benzoyl-CoA reductase/2-hydroxyglutaryl-CoA dehydratase subunit BcrC/BadD/HgdB